MAHTYVASTYSDKIYEYLYVGRDVQVCTYQELIMHHNTTFDLIDVIHVHLCIHKIINMLII